MRVPEGRADGGAAPALIATAWELAAVLAALVLPWLRGGHEGVRSTRARLARGMMVLLGLAGVAVAIHVLGGSPIVQPLMRGLLAALIALSVASGLWIAPLLRRAVRRVRSPAFRASLARVTHLPRWLVIPATVAGGLAEDLARETADWADWEARSGAAWLATGLAMLAEIVLRASLARPEVASATILTVGTLGALVAGLHRDMNEIPA